MTILVGYLPEKGGRASLDLAACLARTGVSERLLVATVVPQPWSTPSLAKVDAEFAAWSADQGSKALATARAHLAKHAPDIEADFEAVGGSSIPRALVNTAQQAGADLIVLGSSADGSVGQVIVGSTAEPLLHASPVAIALAPRGFRVPSAGTISRITCAYSGTEDSWDLVAATARWAARLAVPLRIATFGARGGTMYPPEVGLSAEDEVLDEWTTQALAAQAGAVEHLRSRELLPDGTTTVVGSGSGWTEAVDAVDWHPEEVLVVGSSKLGPLARVFLGSRAIKIIRHSPVPVVVVPSAAVADEVLGDGPAD